MFGRIPKSKVSSPVREKITREEVAAAKGKRPVPGDSVTVFLKTPTGFRTYKRVVTEDKRVAKPDLGPGETVIHHSFNKFTEARLRKRLGMKPSD